jgi:hypothetical protein
MRVASARRKRRSWVTNTSAAAPLLQEALQPVDRLDVQVVGRLVQQQQVGLRDQRPRQQHAPLHAAGQRGEIGSPSSSEPF